MAREKPLTTAWAERAGQRLRWVQASCGDLSPEERTSHLTAELENLAGELPQATRKEALRELLTQFPGLEKEAGNHSSHDGAAAFGDAFIAAPQRPEDMARELAARWASLSAEERAACEAHLAGAGISTTAGPSPLGDLEHMVTLDPLNEGSAALKVELTRSRLDLDDGAHSRPLDLAHVFNLLYELIEHMSDLEDTLPAAWKAWEGMARGSSRIAPLAGSSGKFAGAVKDSITGKDQRSLTIMLRNQSAAARLLMAVTGAIGHGGHFFARQLSKRFSSEQIMQDVRSTKPRPTAEDCWERFMHLSNEMVPSEIEYNLQRAIVRSVEELYHARNPR